MEDLVPPPPGPEFSKKKERRFSSVEHLGIMFRRECFVPFAPFAFVDWVRHGSVVWNHFATPRPASMALTSSDVTTLAHIASTDVTTIGRILGNPSAELPNLRVPQLRALFRELRSRSASPELLPTPSRKAEFIESLVILIQGLRRRPPSEQRSYSHSTPHHSYNSTYHPSSSSSSSSATYHHPSMSGIGSSRHPSDPRYQLPAHGSRPSGNPSVPSGPTSEADFALMQSMISHPLFRGKQSPGERGTEKERTGEEEDTHPAWHSRFVSVPLFFLLPPDRRNPYYRFERALSSALLRSHVRSVSLRYNLTADVLSRMSVGSFRSLSPLGQLAPHITPPPPPSFCLLQPEAWVGCPASPLLAICWASGVDIALLYPSQRVSRQGPGNGVSPNPYPALDASPRPLATASVLPVLPAHGRVSVCVCVVFCGAHRKSNRSTYPRAIGS